MHMCFFSIKKTLAFAGEKKKKIPGQKSSVPWKSTVPDCEGLVEVTDRAAAEPGRLDFIATDLSVRLGLQASA